MKSRFFLFAVLLIVLIGLFVFNQPAVAAPVLQAEDPGPITIPKLSVDLLVSLAGSALSILAWVIPPFRRWQEKWGEWTPAYMSGALLIMATIYQWVWCGYSFSCLLSNWQFVLMIAGTAIAANYLAYKGIVKPAKEKVKRELLRPYQFNRGQG